MMVQNSSFSCFGISPCKKQTHKQTNKKTNKGFLATSVFYVEAATIKEKRFRLKPGFLRWKALENRDQAFQSFDNVTCENREQNVPITAIIHDFNQALSSPNYASFVGSQVTLNQRAIACKRQLCSQCLGFIFRFKI